MAELVFKDEVLQLLVQPWMFTILSALVSLNQSTRKP
jgi:hypothetical protein